MTKPLALGSVLGAIVLFLWSASAWMLIPWPGEPLRSFANEDAVVQAIKTNAPRSVEKFLLGSAQELCARTDVACMASAVGTKYL